jgi:hypothetical protein
MRGSGATIAMLAGMLVSSACSSQETTFQGFGGGAQRLRVVNRDISRLDERNGVRLAPRSGYGVAWVQGSDFKAGMIEVDVRALQQTPQSFVGIAFHRHDDETYEVVYLRPFNFRIADPVRRQHAVQYMSLPKFDWPNLRRDFPEEFENPVQPSVVPTDWVRLRVAVDSSRVQISVGAVNDVTLGVRKLGDLNGGEVGLWVGTDSGGDFANLVVTPAN